MLILSGVGASAHTSVFALVFGEVTLPFGPVGIRSAEPGAVPGDVAIQLAEEYTDPLAAITGRHVPGEVTVILCDREVLHPTLVEPLTDGAVALSAGDTKLAEKMIRVLRAEDSCGDP